MKRYAGDDYYFIINRARLQDRGEYIIRAENHYGSREEVVFLNVQRKEKSYNFAWNIFFFALNIFKFQLYQESYLNISLKHQSSADVNHYHIPSGKKNKSVPQALPSYSDLVSCKNAILANYYVA